MLHNDDPYNLVVQIHKGEFLAAYRYYDSPGEQKDYNECVVRAYIDEKLEM